MTFFFLQAPRQLNMFQFLLFSGALLFSIACSPPRTPIYLNPKWAPTVVEKIIVLPAIDARVDKSEEIQLDKDFLNPLKEKLRYRGYAVGSSQTFGAMNISHIEQIRRLTTTQAQQLGPANAQYVLIPALLDLNSTLEFGSTGNAEIEAWLIEKATGAVVWHDKVVGQAGQGGLMGMAFKGQMAEEALEMATITLFHTLPVKREENEKTIPW